MHPALASTAACAALLAASATTAFVAIALSDRALILPSVAAVCLCTLSSFGSLMLYLLRPAVADAPREARVSCEVTLKEGCTAHIAVSESSPCKVAVFVCD
jgi:hypothetical protein